MVEISPKFQEFQLFWDRKKKLNLTIRLMDVLYCKHITQGAYLLLFVFHILQLK